MPRFIGLLLTAALLSGCGVSLPTPLAPSAGAPEIQRSTNDAGDVELILDPVDVWEEKGLGSPFVNKEVGDGLTFRKRPKEIFERTWVRLGLFWHSRRDDVILTAVIYQPSIKFRRLQVFTAAGTTALTPATDFSFTPPKGFLDRDVSSAVFSMPPSLLQDIADGETSVAISTNRGSLRVNLSAVVGDSPTVLRQSAKYLFAAFAKRQQEDAAAAR